MIKMNNQGSPHVRFAINKRVFRCAVMFSALSGRSWALTVPRSLSTAYPTRQHLMHTTESFSNTFSNEYLNFRHGHCGIFHRNLSPGRPDLAYFPTTRKANPSQGSSRLFLTGRYNNDEDDWAMLKKSAGNILRKTGNKIKNLLPNVKSKPQNRDDDLKKQRSENINAEISNVLSEMPFPIRLMGRMISPFLSDMTEGLAEQSRQMEHLLEEARMRLASDTSVVQKLGEPIQVGRPFSQSSSTTIINGQSSALARASFEVIGPHGSGIATLDSRDGCIQSLVVNIGGTNLAVESMKNYKPYGKKTSASGYDDIIEAEIIEKK